MTTDTKTRRRACRFVTAGLRFKRLTDCRFNWMLRTAVVFLSIWNVLVCPYLCLGQITASVFALTGDQGCSCCHKPADPTQSTPKQPCEGDCNCFCGGAIVSDCKVDCDSLGMDLSIPHPVYESNTAALASPCSTCGLFFSHFPSHSTGRDICTLNCVLLI